MIAFATVLTGVSWVVSRQESAPKAIRYVAKGFVRLGVTMLVALALIMAVVILFMVVGLRDGR